MSTIAASSIRYELLSHLNEARNETDKLFEIVHPAALYSRPIPERNRIVFYIGHLEAFDWNLMREFLQLESFDARLDRLFAFGIDPIDGGLPRDQPEDWPLIEEVMNYRERIRRTIDNAIEANSDEEYVGRLLNFAIEHRLMHAETLEYMFHQLPFEQKISPPFATSPESQAVVSEMVRIPAGSVTLGLSGDSGKFGWDNEFEAHLVEVPAFAIDRYKVTNGEFLRFVEDGGYNKQQLWKEEDWRWKSLESIAHPVFWHETETGWSYRGMFEEIPLPLHSPVFVSHSEACAYARWAGKTLPTEAQWQRAASGVIPAAESRVLWNPPNIGSYPAQQSKFGVQDLSGTGWEWTSTVFAPFEGFQIAPEYPGYSANFFDGKHYVMKGGSTRTAAAMLRLTFRNWFQAHYQYVYAGFRCVKSE